MKKVIKIGDILTIPITGYGVGSGTANNVEVTITYPDGVTFLDFGDPGNYTDNGSDGEWNLGNQSLNFEETENIRFTVTDVEALYNQPEVTWEIDFDGLDYPLSNNSTRIIVDGVPCSQIMDCVDLHAPEQYKHVWVDSEYGDDDEAELERFDKPYETIQQALTDIAALVDNEEWTVNIRGYFTGVQDPLLIPNKCILNFENVVVENDLIFDDLPAGIDIAYITGLIRTEAVTHVIEIAATESICLKDLILVNDGIADIIQDDAFEIYTINVATNGNIGFANLTIVGDAFKYIPGLN